MESALPSDSIRMPKGPEALRALMRYTQVAPILEKFIQFCKDNNLVPPLNNDLGLSEAEIGVVLGAQHQSLVKNVAFMNALKAGWRPEGLTLSVDIICQFLLHVNNVIVETKDDPRKNKIAIDMYERAEKFMKKDGLAFNTGSPLVNKFFRFIAFFALENGEQQQ